jgi:hypothetical protein
MRSKLRRSRISVSLIHRHILESGAHSCAVKRPKGKSLGDDACATPVHSQVPRHDEMAKREEAGQLDKVGGRLGVPIYRSICKHASPRSGSGQTVDHNLLEQRSHRRAYQPAEGDQAADVRMGRFRTSQSAPAALGDFKRRLTCTECAEDPLNPTSGCSRQPKIMTRKIGEHWPTVSEPPAKSDAAPVGPEQGSRYSTKTLSIPIFCKSV